MERGRYVDDLFGGADSIYQAQETVIQLSQLCKAGGFLLKKWISNEASILNSISSTDRLDSTNLLIDDSILVHSLGLSWSPTLDSFRFINGIEKENTVTKRVMLSTISKIFDPLGFLSPVIITAKLLIQELWVEKVGWDQRLPPKIVLRWTNFIDTSGELSKLEFPRWIGTSNSSCSLELHGFCDASLKTMAAVIFCRNISLEGQISIQFVCAKTKVAPLKRCTIPRLELMGAVLLTKLVAHVPSSLHKEDIKIYLWTDSTITLTWVTGHPSQWKDFVHNRVVFIQDSLPMATWRFIPGLENPADMATRGLTPAQLLQTRTWWHGPVWLALPSQYWPSMPHEDLNKSNLEERPAHVSTTSIQPHQPWNLLDKYSSLKKLLRVTAILQRAIKCYKRLPDASLSNPLSPAELKQAKEFWIKEVQRYNFPRELKVLSSKNSLEKHNPLIRLTPFIDAKGILRVGGRLNSSDLSYEAKHPAIIPKKSTLTTLIISEAHFRSLHGGTQLTTSLLREEFWIIGGRTTVRSHIFNCVICARFRKRRAQQLMGHLPPERVHPSPFLHSGVDYAGPFPIKTWRGKNARTYKGYVAIFVCFATSAIHLELVTDNTADAFMAAYKRFTSRRGLCATLISDCGTNFKGANAELQRLFSAATKESHQLAVLLAQDGTHWKFNPPSTPHFGGKWEAGVKSMKGHLKRVIGNHLLTFEEMTTILTQVESVLNSRPSCPMTDDPEDLTVLTHGHFIMGCAPTVIPEPSLEEEKTTRLSRWQLLRKMLDSLWSKWSTEYLQRFHSTFKWNKSTTPIKQGSMVLVADERLPPAKWPLGRVIQVHPGRDGLIRIVTVKTQVSEYTRPITKLCPLPIDNNAISLFINYRN